MLDTNGLSSDTPAALVETFRAAGVPEAEASRFYRGLPSDRVANAGAVLLFVGFVVVVLGPRPRRGTRWFWFWIVGGPLSVGLPIFAVAELLRPRYEAEGTVHPPGVAGRWSGLAGFARGSCCRWRSAGCSSPSAVCHRSGSSAPDRSAAPGFPGCRRPRLGSFPAPRVVVPR